MLQRTFRSASAAFFSSFASFHCKDIISQTQVYVLCIPSRRKHASKLMERWGFDAELVNGPDKHEILDCR